MYSSDESTDESFCKNRSRKIYSANNDKGNFCLMCREVFPDFLTTLGHECRPFKCKDCFKKFEYDYQFTIHKCVGENSNETELNSFKCSFCNSLFERLSLLELHENSCFKKKEQYDKCNLTVSPCLNKYEVLKRKRQCNRSNQPNLLYDEDIFCKNKTFMTETREDVSYCNSSDRIKHINSKRSLNDMSFMDSKKRKINNLNSSIKVSSKVNKCPNNVNNSVISNPPNLTVQKALHFSGKFRNSKRNKNKSSSDISKTCNDNVKKITPKRRKEVPEEKTCDVTAESTNNIILSDVPESNTSANEEINDREMNLKSNFKETKDATSVKVILSDIQKLPTVDMFKNNQVENQKRSNKEMAKTDMLIMENFAKKLKVTLESTSNVTFNGIHSSHSSGQKIKPLQKKTINISNKCLTRKKTNKVTRKSSNTASNFQSSEKGENGLSTIYSLKELSSDKRKTKRSNSKDHDSGLESFETSSSSSSMSAVSEVPNVNNIKKIPSSNTEMENLIKVSDSQQQKCKKDSLRKKPITNKSNNLLPKETNHTPLELVVSESTLNDTSDDIHSKKTYPKLKECYVRGGKPLIPKLKTENNVELGDLLNGLPPQSGILVKASPGSFHNFRCPKCNKLFKHFRTGSNHLVSCRILKFKKNLTVPYDEIIYVCTACHFNCTRKLDLTNHKMTCTPNSITDILFNYDGTNKQFVCPRCSFSCLTQQMYDGHPCTKRLKYMQTCIVNVEKINPFKFMLADGTTIKCEPGESRPYSVARAYNVAGQESVQKQKKRFIKNLKKCNAVSDVLENVVRPVIKCNEFLEPGNTLPDLNFDVTIPYEHQKLLAEYAEDGLPEDEEIEELLDDDELLKITNIFEEEDDYDSSDFDAQNDELLIRLRNYKCHCKNKTSDAEPSNKESSDTETSNTEKKPCLPCLNGFIKEYVLTDPVLNLEMPTESKENNDILQQGIDNQTASSSSHIYSFIDNNAAGTSGKHASSMISFDICASSSTDGACFSNAEVQLKTSSDFAVSSHNDTTSAADLSAEVQSNTNSKHEVLPNNSEIIASNKFQLDVAEYDNKCASPDAFVVNCDNKLDSVKRDSEDFSDDIIPYESHVPSGESENDNNPGDFQVINANLEGQNELDISTSNTSSSELEIIKKDEITMMLFNTECKAEVFTDEVKMTVTAGGIDEINLKSKQFQILLFDLFAKLQVTISLFEDNADIYLKVLNTLTDEELNVDIVNKSVHLYIPFTFEESVEYSAYVLKGSGEGMCEECEENFTFPILIKHIIQEHQKTDIYISIV